MNAAISASTPAAAVAPQEKPKAREPLPPEEKKELVKQEKLLAVGFLHVRNCAEALRVVRDRRLYRAEFDTFQDYCEKRWKRERATVNLMLAAFEVRKEMETALAENGKNFCQIESAKSLLNDTSDHAVRELAKVEPENRIKVFEQAAQQSNGAPPTAAAVREAKEEFSLSADGPPKPPVKTKPQKNPKRNGHAPAKKPKLSRDNIKNIGAYLSAYDEWQDARAGRWQRDFGARAWRAYNAQVFQILREVRGWWEARMKSEAGI